MSVVNVFSFIGGPASGKGYQARRLEEYISSKGFPAVHVSIGDLIRRDKNNIDLINLSEDNKVIDIIFNYAGEFKQKYEDYSTQEGITIDDLTLILDGFPRNKKQASFLINNFAVRRVYLLQASNETLDERMVKRGRSEEIEENNRFKRISDYTNLTSPVVTLFSKEIVKSIDSEKPKEINSQEIRKDVYQNFIRTYPKLIK